MSSELSSNNIRDINTEFYLLDEQLKVVYQVLASLQGESLENALYSSFHTTERSKTRNQLLNHRS